jgi:hypothetical protein
LARDLSATVLLELSLRAVTGQWLTFIVGCAAAMILVWDYSPRIAGTIRKAFGASESKAASKSLQMTVTVLMIFAALSFGGLAIWRAYMTAADLPDGSVPATHSAAGDVLPIVKSNSGMAIGQQTAQVINNYNSPPLAATTHAALYEVQLAELREIDKFVGIKNEWQLRDTFDFIDMIKFNIRFAKNMLFPNSVPAQQLQELDAFFAGGLGILNYQHGTWARRPDGGAANFVPFPGKVFALNQSAKQAEAVSRLHQYESSSTVPADVRERLKEFSATVDQNVTLMFEVINERTSKNKNNLLHDDDPSSDRLGVINNAYWAKFTNLEPKARAVNEAIRHHLDVK